jgi:hypothetical protein
MTLLIDDGVTIQVWVNETLLRGEATGQLATDKDTPVLELIKLLLDRSLSRYNDLYFNIAQIHILHACTIGGILILHNSVPILFVPFLNCPQNVVIGNMLNIEVINVKLAPSGGGNG